MSNTPLNEKKCQPCEGIGKPLSSEQAATFLNDISQWNIDESGKWIKRVFNTRNFSAAVDFINKIKDVAEEEDHHPDIHLTNYRILEVALSTHALGGLSENDFILAAKINDLPVDLKV